MADTDPSLARGIAERVVSRTALEVWVTDAVSKNPAIAQVEETALVSRGVSFRDSSGGIEHLSLARQNGTWKIRRFHNQL